MSLSKEETKVYDRQIRLWGMDGQNRMRNTKILVYGMTGVSCEILKNLVLAGVGCVRVMDDASVEEKDLGYQFFVREDDVGKNVSTCFVCIFLHSFEKIANSSYMRIQELNPFVKVTFDTDNIVDKKESFFDSFDIVILAKCCLKIQIWVNQICRSKGIKFITADMFGMLGISFQDWGNCFHYVVKQNKKEIEREADFLQLEDVYRKVTDWSKYSKPWNTAQCIMTFMDNFKKFPDGNFVKESKVLLKRKNVSLDDYSDEYLESVGVKTRAHLSPLCAVFGGIVSNEVIKCICRDGDPINNYFVYDGIETFCGIVEKVC